jgi:hypothetical protein
MVSHFEGCTAKDRIDMLARQNLTSEPRSQSNQFACCEFQSFGGVGLHRVGDEVKDLVVQASVGCAHV